MTSETSLSLSENHHGGSMTAEEVSAKRELVKKLVKSILCSSKDGITEQELRFEYRAFTNENIPYAQLGYKSLYELVKDFGVACISRLPTGLYVFHPIYDELTKDLGSLVVHQIDRDKPTRDIRRVREGMRVRVQNRFGAPFAGFANPFAIGHGHHSILFASSPAAATAATAATAASIPTIKPFVPSNVQKNIQTVLEAQENQTLAIKEFQVEYISMFGVSLVPREMGFNTLEDIFRNVPHLVQIFINSTGTDLMVCLTKSEHQQQDDSKSEPMNNEPAAPSHPSSSSNINGAVAPNSSSSNTNNIATTTTTTTNNNSNNNNETSKQIVDENNNNIAEIAQKPATTTDSSTPMTTSTIPQTYPTTTTTSITTTTATTTTTTIKSTTPKKPLTPKQQVVYEILRLIVNTGSKGLNLMSIGQTYAEVYGEQLEFEKFGYTSASTFIVENLPTKNLDISKAESFGDYTFRAIPGRTIEDMMMLNNNNNDDRANDAGGYGSKSTVTNGGGEGETANGERFKKTSMREKIRELRDNCRNVLGDHLDKRLSVSEFWRAFEAKLGWRPTPGDYECRNFDELVAKLYQTNALMIELDQRHRLFVYLPSKQSLRSPCPLAHNQAYRSDSSQTKEQQLTAEEKKELAKKQMEEFIQRYVWYDKEIPSGAIMRKIAQKSRHEIIVSNVRSPREMQIQLAENVDQLNFLMDELERIYVSSICSRSFNMPLEYVKFGRLCAAIYPADLNWHRCRIIGLNKDANWAKVNYLDYGGDSVVGFDNIKFLSNQCAELPPQAVQAHFFNIRQPSSNGSQQSKQQTSSRYQKPNPKTPANWLPETINYLLNMVINQTLEAEVKGLNGDSLALVFYKREQNAADGQLNWVNLNEMLVRDGFGEFYDETNDCTFKEFEIWSRKTLETELNSNQPPTDKPKDSSTPLYQRKLNNFVNGLKTSSNSRSSSPNVNDTTKRPTMTSATTASTTTNNGHASPSRRQTTASTTSGGDGGGAAESTVTNDESSNVTSRKSAIEKQRKLKDKMDEEAKLRAGIVELKEQLLAIKIPRRSQQMYLNVLAINKYAYIHAKQLMVLTGSNEAMLNSLLKNLTSRLDEQAEQQSTKNFNSYFLNINLTEATLEIFDWLVYRVGLDVSKMSQVRMLRYDKIEVFLDGLLPSEIAPRYKDLVKNAKHVPIPQP